MTRGELESLIDTEELALMTAINYVVGNMDDMRTNYNNHYIYFRKSDGKVVFIPYDVELILDINYYFSPCNFDMTAESPYYDYNYAHEEKMRSSLIRQFALKGGFFTDSYTKYLLDIAQSKWLTVQNYLYYYRIAEKNYADKVVQGIHFRNTTDNDLSFSMENNRNDRNDMPIGQYFQRMRENILTRA